MINNKDMIGPKLVELKSVGCLLDVDTADVYPQLESGEPDWENSVSLYEDIMPGDWLDSLSEEDMKLVQPYIQ